MVSFLLPLRPSLTLNFSKDKSKTRECSSTAIKTIAPEPVPTPVIQIQEMQDTEMVEIIPVDDGKLIKFQIYYYYYLTRVISVKNHRI